MSARKAASLLRLTKAESLLPIAQGYEVTHERASLASLSRLTKAESLHLSRKAMRSRMRAQGYGVCYEFGEVGSLS